MKSVHFHCAVLVAVTLPLSLGGCVVTMGPGAWGQARSNRTWTGQIPKDTLAGLSVKTQSGAIAVTGADVADFDITAEITAYAPTEEKADELAGQVEVVCKPNGDTLEIEAQYPKPSFNGGVTINYTITVPRRTHVQCRSSYGKLSFENLEGTVSGRTSSGAVEARHILGPTDLESSYGAITCSDVNGPTIVLRTSSGAVHAANIAGSLRAGSSYGAVSCQGFSQGDLALKSSSGRVEVSEAICGTCEAQSSYGAVSAQRVQGRVLRLHSSSGAITAAQAQADQMNLSTSYGGVIAQDVTTSDLVAESASGSVNCTLTPECPAGLAANVVSSYGSVSLAVPTGYAGQVDLSTDYGSIHTDLPVTVSGEVSKKRLIGSVGSGPGRIRLHTSSGSVSLR